MRKLVAERTPPFGKAGLAIMNFLTATNQSHQNCPIYQMEKRYFDKNRQIVFVRLSVSVIRDPDGEPFYFVAQIENITELKNREVERENLIAELRESLARVKTLSGLIPICGWCKNVRADKGYWQTVEQYVLSQTEATFSHGICPDCQEKLKADIARVNAKP